MSDPADKPTTAAIGGIPSWRFWVALALRMSPAIAYVPFVVGTETPQ